MLGVTSLLLKESLVLLLREFILLTGDTEIYLYSAKLLILLLFSIKLLFGVPILSYEGNVGICKFGLGFWNAELELSGI